MFPHSLKYVKEQTREICLAAVKKDGIVLEFVKEQNLEICLAAVKQDGWSLYYVKEQTPEICLAAVSQEGVALLHVIEQTLEICLAAVSKNGMALQCVREQTLEICQAAVKNNYKALNYVDAAFLYHLITVELLNPTELIDLPNEFIGETLIDPVSFEEVVKDDIIAFLKEENKYYFVCSLTSINEIITQRFRGSDKANVYVPLKNALMPVDKLLCTKY